MQHANTSSARIRSEGCVQAAGVQVQGKLRLDGGCSSVIDQADQDAEEADNNQQDIPQRAVRKLHCQSAVPGHASGGSLERAACGQPQRQGPNPHVPG